MAHLPPEWEDDKRMDVLFANFRETRDVNPRDWDNKLKFWSQTITDECTHGSAVYFDLKTLPHRFRRKEKVPRCLNKVVQEMKRLGKLQSVGQFQASVDMGWMSWGLDVMVKSPLRWSWKKVVGEPQIDLTEEYVVTEVLKEKAALVLERHHRDCKNKATGNIVEFKELEKTCADICRDSKSLLLVLTQLRKDKKVHITETQKKEKLVKFVHKEELAVKPLSDVEKKILRVRQTVEKLEEEIHQLSEEMERCRKDARFYVSKGMSNSAKNALRRKKKLEIQQHRREAALMNIHTLLGNIEDAESDKMIAEAYESGVSAFKLQVKQAGLDTDRLDETMSDMQEVFDINADINDTLSQGVSEAALDISTSDLEAELESLLAEDEGATVSPEKTQVPGEDLTDLESLGELSISESDLPSVPSFDPHDMSADQHSYRTSALQQNFH